MFIAVFVALGLEPSRWVAAMVIVLAAHGALFGSKVVASVRREHAPMTVPVIVYFAVIMLMAVAAALSGRGWAIVGASSFVVSDTVLGWGRFVREHRWQPLAVMVTYHVALAGLAVSL